jgi:hypothetical protein
VLYRSRAARAARAAMVPISRHAVCMLPACSLSGVSFGESDWGVFAGPLRATPLSGRVWERPPGHGGCPWRYLQSKLSLRALRGLAYYLTTYDLPTCDLLPHAVDCTADAYTTAPSSPSARPHHRACRPARVPAPAACLHPALH